MFNHKSIYRKIKFHYHKVCENIHGFKLFFRWLFRLGKIDGISISWNKNQPNRRHLHFKAIYSSEDDQFYMLSLWWFTLILAPEHYVWNELFDYRMALTEIIKENPAFYALSSNELVRKRAERHLYMQSRHKDKEQ